MVSGSQLYYKICMLKGSSLFVIPDVKVKKFAPCASTSTTNVHCPNTCTNSPVTDNPVTPPIPSIEACMEACPASLEFKPVCGNNNVTYRNLEKLQCARRCGIGKKILIF